MGMNMNALMAQARQMQNEMTKIAKEIENTTFEEEKNNVKVEIKGNYEVKRISILDKSLLEDAEMLEDAVVVAINGALSQIQQTKSNKLGKFTGGMSGIL